MQRVTPVFCKGDSFRVELSLNLGPTPWQPFLLQQRTLKVLFDLQYRDNGKENGSYFCTIGNILG